MLRFAWRWIRRGDRVLVHDIDDQDTPLRPGVVTHVERGRSGTRAGIRLDPVDENPVVWMPSVYVHPDPLDPEESCPMCDHRNAHADA